MRRLVCVSSTATTGEMPPGETFVFRRLIAPVLLRFGRTLYADMHRMEQIVSASGLDWTVVRPAGLFDTTEVTDYTVSATERLPGRFTSRADLADLLLREAVTPAHTGRFVEVITTTGAPTFARMFAREALGIGRQSPP